MARNNVDILNQIDVDLEKRGKENLSNASDSDLINTSEKESSKYGEQYDRRDKLYSDLLQNYINSNKSKADYNKKYKLWFFIISLASFVTILHVSLIILIILAIKGGDSASDVAAAVGGTAGIISSIIAIPKIIAVHLFPTNEDTNMIGLVQNMQKNDSGIRNTSNDEKIIKKTKPDNK